MSISNLSDFEAKKVWLHLEMSKLLSKVARNAAAHRRQSQAESRRAVLGAFDDSFDASRTTGRQSRPQTQPGSVGTVTVPIIARCRQAASKKVCNAQRQNSFLELSLGGASRSRTYLGIFLIPSRQFRHRAVENRASLLGIHFAIAKAAPEQASDRPPAHSQHIMEVGSRHRSGLALLYGDLRSADDPDCARPDDTRALNSSSGSRWSRFDDALAWSLIAAELANRDHYGCVTFT